MVGVLCLGAASVVGGATGFGTALIGTPLMLLAGMDVASAVVVNLSAGLVTRVVVAYRLRAMMDRRRVCGLSVGAVPGALMGAAVLSALPGEALRIVAGAATVVCGLWLAIPGRAVAREPGGVATVATGVVGGFLTTSTSLGGPPPVLLMQYARVAPATFVADLAGYFVVTCGLSLSLLAVGGLIPPGLTWWIVLASVGAALLGNAVGSRIARWIPGEALRYVVITLVVVAGAMTALV